MKLSVFVQFLFEQQSQKETLPFLGSVSFCVCVRRTQHRLRVYSQHHLTVRSTSLSEYGHKTMLRLRRKRCGYANDVLPLAKTMLRLRRKYTPTRDDVALRANIWYNLQHKRGDSNERSKRNR